MQNFMSLKKLTLLFVEDEVVLKQQTGEMLGVFFDRVLMASNGIEALKYLASEEIDIILSDIKMPLMDGLSLVREIRNSGNQIPFILISSFSDQDILLNAANSGIDGYIIKPIKLDDLMQIFLRVLIRRNMITQRISLGSHCCYDIQTQELYQNDVIIELGKKERELLKLFIDNAPKTMMKQKILSAVWPNESVSDSSLKNLVGRLRKKVGIDLIVSVKGAGWRLNISG